jgi:hypothetical protein
VERLIRGIMQIGGFPEAEDALKNWRELVKSEPEWPTVEDKQIFEYLRTYYHQMGAPPDFALAKEFFEKDDNIEGVARLDEIKSAQLYIGANYRSILQSVLETQEKKAMILLMRDASAIVEHGKSVEVGKGRSRHFKGCDDAIDYLRERTPKVSRRGHRQWEIRTLSDVAKPARPIRSLMTHFRMTAGRPNGLVGFAGSAKTFMAIELALAVAAGRPTCWGGLDVRMQGPVVHLDYEMGWDLLHRRYQRAARGLGLDLEDIRGVRPQDDGRQRSVGAIIRDGFAAASSQAVSNDSLLHISSGARKYLTTKGIERDLVDLLTGKTLCILDNFCAATLGAVDENSSAMADYLYILGRVSTETGCVIVVLHHLRKGDPGAEQVSRMAAIRGSSAIVGAFGATVHVEPGKEKGAFKIGSGKVSTGRVNDDVFVRLEDRGTYCEDYDDHEGIVLVHAEQTVEDSQLELDIRRVCRVIVDAGGQVENAAELRRLMTGVGNARVNDAVKMMRDRGMLAAGKGYALAPVMQPEDCLS